MGFNKLYVTKSKILYFLKQQQGIEALERDIKIEKLFFSECTISDSWSANFLNDLNKKERKIRQEYFESNPIFTDTNLAEKMTSKSETLISLYFNNKNPFDILVTKNLLNSSPISKKIPPLKYYNNQDSEQELLIDLLIDSFE